MAIDSAGRRGSALDAGLPPGVGPLPIPDGTIDAADRAALAGGFLEEGPAPPDGGDTEGVYHMSQYLFGAGTLWGTPLTDANGNAIATPSPVNFGALQNISLDISFDTKMLYGGQQFPLAVGRGKGKVSGKASAAKINGLLWNSIVFGQTLNNSGRADVFDTTGKAIPSSPFTITVSNTASDATHVQIPNSGTLDVILGVRDQNNNPMTQVASGPTTGQYSVAGGVITFAAADTGQTVFIDYAYTYTSTVAKSGTVQNVLMGYAPSFQVDLYVPYAGKQLMVRLPNCISTKLSIATKLDDFTEPEFDFEAFADSLGRVLIYGTSE
jgi:hypothetical protein